MQALISNKTNQSVSVLTTKQKVITMHKKLFLYRALCSLFIEKPREVNGIDSFVLIIADDEKSSCSIAIIVVVSFRNLIIDLLTITHEFNLERSACVRALCQHLPSLQH